MNDIERHRETCRLLTGQNPAAKLAPFHSDQTDVRRQPLRWATDGHGVFRHPRTGRGGGERQNKYRQE